MSDNPIDNHPTPETLERWHKQWRKISSDAWRELMDSLTPEQRALYQQWQRAGKQAALCNERLRKRTPIAKRQLAWPAQPPPNSNPAHRKVRFFISYNNLVPPICKLPIDNDYVIIVY